MQQVKNIFRCIVILSSLFLTARCAQTSSVTTTAVFSWLSGQSTVLSNTVYGNQGTFSATNIPGARKGAMTWRDKFNNLWLFGGYGLSGSGTTAGYLNDLWVFNGAQWSWIGGSNTLNSTGSYGTTGIPTASNSPPARMNGLAWVDLSGNFWLFGGQGPSYNFNDVWKFNGLNWTWVAGPQGNAAQLGVYGSKGVSAAANHPGARTQAAGAADPQGNFWLFGGSGYTDTAIGTPTDLWQFNISTLCWTWMGGTNLSAQSGSYGAQGIASGSNIPGARYGAAYWTDPSGNFWMFGGNGVDGSGVSGYLNDLWKFDGTAWIWTWVSGSAHANEISDYGYKGIPSSTNMPGGRMNATGFTDEHNNQWVFQGTTGVVRFADFWKFDGTNWTWAYGSNVADQNGTYGLQGVSLATSSPGAREETTGWTAANGSFYLFGGYGVDSGSGYSYLNDLWHFSP